MSSPCPICFISTSYNSAALLPQNREATETIPNRRLKEYDVTSHDLDLFFLLLVLCAGVFSIAAGVIGVSGVLSATDLIALFAFALAFFGPPIPTPARKHIRIVAPA